LHLTNIVHEAEQAYDELRNNSETPFDKHALLAQLQDVLGNIEEYASLNDAKLGRKGPGRRGSAEKYVMVQRTHVDQMIAELGAYDLQAARQETLAALLSQIKLDLKLIGTEPIQNILGGVFESLPSLAKELGKEPPQLEIADHGIQIRNQVTDLLRNVSFPLCNGCACGARQGSCRRAHTNHFIDLLHRRYIDVTSNPTYRFLLHR
jgi:hypothetical protein